MAITRARRRVEVVATISAGDIVSDNPSIKHLQRYLDYAERGQPALAVDLEGSQGDAESPFEEEVLNSLRSMGHDAVPQVGVAGYRIDVGVRHPTKPGSYLLGVECDGASYHSSKVARDRDRLRQEVLEGLGWSIHRIWSTSWFADRRGEERRLADAITASLRGDAQPPSQSSYENDTATPDSMRINVRRRRLRSETRMGAELRRTRSARGSIAKRPSSTTHVLVA